MQKCIFCKSTTGPFNTHEHILPESLGGSAWAILPDGLFCDCCQNRFGSSIEQQALADYPFSLLRVLLGIPTKKGKAPWLTCWEGKIQPSTTPGLIYYEPAEPFKKAMEEERKSQIRILAHPLRPDIVCRFLLKMAIEVVAADDPQAVFDERLDEARDFALLGEKPNNWWYLQYEDIELASYHIIHGVTLQEWVENVKLEIANNEEGAQVFHLKLLYIDLFTPLESQIQPPLRESMTEPACRFFSV